MALQKTEAVILKSFNWAESSRTVVLFSKERGKLALIDKGGRSFKSKRGRLFPFARFEITYYSSHKESSGYVSEVDLLEQFSLEGEGSLGRLTFASAACELLYVLLPEEEPQAPLYNYFLKFMGAVPTVDKKCLPSIFLAFFLRMLAHLGYHPSLAFCISCKSESHKISAIGGHLQFSPDRGGIVCPACQRPGEYYIPLSAEGHRIAVAVQVASLEEAAALRVGYRETIKLVEVLAKFIGFQTGLNSKLKSLEFLEKLKNSELLK